MVSVSEVASVAHLAVTMLLEMSASRRFILRVYISIRISISCIYRLAYIALLVITYIVRILLHVHRVSIGYYPYLITIIYYNLI